MCRIRSGSNSSRGCGFFVGTAVVAVMVMAVEDSVEGVGLSGAAWAVSGGARIGS
jgi:hypothetical protein